LTVSSALIPESDRWMDWIPNFMFIQEPNAPLPQAVNNISAVLGWQLSGIFGTDPEVPSFCNNVDVLSSKWVREGLNVNLISSILCQRMGCSLQQDGFNIFTQVLGHVRNLFTVE
jgi:hypothetical protein